MKPLIDIQQFLALSSFLNYQLSGEPINWRGILNLVVGDKLSVVNENFLIGALRFLCDAYGEEKRHLGPKAILHPIRAASLLAKAQEIPSTLDLLTTLLHDKNEDITPDRYSSQSWRRLEKTFDEFLQEIDPDLRGPLAERISYLTKSPEEKYYVYLGRLLECARETPELAAIKLADRLDNTMDLRVDLHDFTEEAHCYQLIFDALYVNSFTGFKLKRPHPISRKINGAMRLYQLYKNAVFLSLLRASKITLDEIARKLFFSLAVSSIREAQTILLHIFAYHMQDPKDQRNLLLDTMQYSHSGGFGYIGDSGEHRLDGLFKNYFEYDTKQRKKEVLDMLYNDKELMGMASLAFIVIFANFTNDEDFTIQGITPSGIIAQEH